MTAVALNEVAVIHGGGRLKLSGKDFVEQGVAAYGAAGLNGMVATAEHDREGIILSSIGARCGKCFYVKGRWTSLANTQVILPDPSRAHARYLWYQLNDETRWPRSGSAQPFIKPSDVKSHRIYLPPLDEQWRVVTMLDQVEGIRTKAAASIEVAASAIESRFRQSFGGLSATTTVEAVAAPEKGSVRTGPFGSQLLHSEFTAEGIAVLGIDNVVTNDFGWRERRYISPEKYEQLKRYTVGPGDVLITIMGTCGRCVVVPDDIPLAINTKHLCAITVDKRVLLPNFLRACFLWHPEARRHLASHTKGAVMDGLNMGIIKSMPLPLPPMSAQIDFVEAAIGIMEQTQRLVQREAELDALADVLRTQAFSGKV